MTAGDKGAVVDEASGPRGRTAMFKPLLEISAQAPRRTLQGLYMGAMFADNWTSPALRLRLELSPLVGFSVLTIDESISISFVEKFFPTVRRSTRYRT